ncbi:sulfurtransferase/chromate resistance protein [Cognatiyoonia sp. IB215182]|uniref:sulfurtransferase/chromate resistance protein n=1 Tax=Cognatiyoonia sp. IB215182 TaxID=3097353 RepID=UPI002A178961|nr:sulfurtransferase/chromate resistance protein [Cognatiyoonia sp. IB215182]MDX8353522.1 sulfurtransferase/chromate resistance protein [Cognatiyoonia sp. IB215182]
MAALNEITPAQLMRLIGTPECPVIVDVCIDDDFSADPFLVPTAFRHPHTDIAGLKERLTRSKIVCVCQKGLKLSHGVAAYLRADGYDAQVLEGGNHAWRAAGLPRLDVKKVPGSTWVTRHRPKIDRIACPWLIRRFVDPNATFLFVPPATVMDVAARFDATPFDIEGVEWSHEGEDCTFDMMIKTFGLSHPALDALATIVRAADTNQHALAPQAAGLLAISVGLSRMFREDNAQLNAGMIVYDALYRWARDGQNEGHDWPSRHGT